MTVISYIILAFEHGYHYCFLNPNTTENRYDEYFDST